MYQKEWYEKYGRFFLNSERNFSHYFNRTYKFIPPIKGKVLELSVGKHSKNIRSLGKGIANVTTVDISITMLTGTYKLFRDNRLNDYRLNYFVCGDVEELSFKDNYFDTVVGFSILHHVENPQKVIKEAIRVTKNGGIIYFEEANPYSPFYGLIASMFKVERKILERNRMTYEDILKKNAALFNYYTIQINTLAYARLPGVIYDFICFLEDAYNAVKALARRIGTTIHITIYK